MTPILRRMLDDMRLRNLAPNTQASYIHRVSVFARHFDRSPEMITPEESACKCGFPSLEWRNRGIAFSGNDNAVVALQSNQLLYLFVRQRRGISPRH